MKAKRLEGMIIWAGEGRTFLQQTYLIHSLYSFCWWKVTDAWVMKRQPFSWIHLPLWKAKWGVYLLKRPRGDFTALSFVSIVRMDGKPNVITFPSMRGGWSVLPKPGHKAGCGFSRFVTLFKIDMGLGGMQKLVTCFGLLACFLLMSSVLQIFCGPVGGPEVLNGSWRSWMG